MGFAHWSTFQPVPLHKPTRTISPAPPHLCHPTCTDTRTKAIVIQIFKSTMLALHYLISLRLTPVFGFCPTFVCGHVWTACHSDRDPPSSYSQLQADMAKQFEYKTNVFSFCEFDSYFHSKTLVQMFQNSTRYRIANSFPFVSFQIIIHHIYTLFVFQFIHISYSLNAHLIHIFIVCNS